jgi:hypothetical protein
MCSASSEQRALQYEFLGLIFAAVQILFDCDMRHRRSAAVELRSSDYRAFENTEEEP